MLEICIQQKPFSTVSSIERDAQNNDNDIRYVVKDEYQVRLVKYIIICILYRLVIYIST
jgi:hypothetical protein